METQILFTAESIVIPPLELPSREIGACLEFQGIVRATEGDRQLAGLQYEAHEPMARKQWDPLESTCRHASLSIL